MNHLAHLSISQLFAQTGWFEKSLKCILSTKNVYIRTLAVWESQGKLVIHPCLNLSLTSSKQGWNVCRVLEITLSSFPCKLHNFGLSLASATAVVCTAYKSGTKKWMTTNAPPFSARYQQQQTVGGRDQPVHPPVALHVLPPSPAKGQSLPATIDGK